METKDMKRKRGKVAVAGNEREDPTLLLPSDYGKDNSRQQIEPGPDEGLVMPELCIRCLSMFSSLEGLRALASTRGYRHYDKKGLEDSATDKLGDNPFRQGLSEPISSRLYDLFAA